MAVSFNGAPIRFAPLAFLITSLTMSNLAQAEIIHPGEFYGVPRKNEICANSYRDFHLTSRLRPLTLYFEENSSTGYVNDSEGSYFEIDTRDETLTITFLTSGIWDLTLIRKNGPIEFCDDGSGLVAKGIDRVDRIWLSPGSITFGRGGPKLTFRKGRKPHLLQKLDRK